MNYLLAHIDKIIALMLLLGMSIGVRLLLQALGQRWITTTAHTATLVLLPLLTYVITNVISGNIALSLGMVGALSIVRFRNPVRSPLELSVYFGAITMGIAATVSLLWLFFLAGAIISAVSVLAAIQYICVRYIGRSFFTASFSEGNTLSSLEVTTTAEIKDLDESRLLTVKRSHEGQIEYTLTSSNFLGLKDLCDRIKNNDTVKNYQLNS